MFDVWYLMIMINYYVYTTFMYPASMYMCLGNLFWLLAKTDNVFFLLFSDYERIWMKKFCFSSLKHNLFEFQNKFSIRINIISIESTKKKKKNLSYILNISITKQTNWIGLSIRSVNRISHKHTGMQVWVVVVVVWLVLFF